MYHHVGLSCSFFPPKNLAAEHVLESCCILDFTMAGGSEDRDGKSTSSVSPVVKSRDSVVKQTHICTRNNPEWHSQIKKDFPHHSKNRLRVI